MGEQRTDVVDRLRGIYTVPVNDGAGLLDGKDTFTQVFPGLPPIQYEAANEIERLRNELAETKEALRVRLKQVDDCRLAMGNVVKFCGVIPDGAVKRDAIDYIVKTLTKWNSVKLTEQGTVHKGS